MNISLKNTGIIALTTSLLTGCGPGRVTGPAADSGQIALNSHPDSASVTVMHNVHGRPELVTTTTTPDTLSLEEGAYSFVFERPGYAPQKIVEIVRANDLVSLDAQLPPRPQP